MLLACLVIVIGSPMVMAETLYEKYTQASRSDLEAETRQMGNQLKNEFNANSINLKRQQIDFSKYFSNMKKLVTYGTKLATYSEYRKDLEFARDNEMFKGLPEEKPDSRETVGYENDKELVEKKFERMTKNVQEEINTYTDLINLSLDVCENLTEYDLSDMLSNREYADKIRTYTRSEEYRAYMGKRERLAQGWPKLESEISAQFMLWEPKPASPDDPVIDPRVTGAL
jgi:hypothetical protein